VLENIASKNFYTPKSGQKLIQELEKNIHSYSLFWPEWIKNEACTLNEEDLYIIEVHTKNNFKINLFESFMFYNQAKRIECIVSKLRTDYKYFKEWMITNFLFHLISLINCSDRKDFSLYAPIGYLSIPVEIKSKLRSFKVKTVYEIFEKYKEEDLKSATVFSNIIAFERILIETNLQA